MRAYPFALGLAALLTAGTAGANPGISGYSGKPYNGEAPQVCTTSCHAQSGTAPTLTVTAPTAVTAGKSFEVTIVVAGGRSGTLINAALSDGSVATKGQNTDVPFPDVSPSEISSGLVNGGTGTFKFTFVPPNRNGDMKLWVTGMATNNNGSTAGDATKSDIKTITVSGATAAQPDAGSSTSSSTSSSGSTSSSSGSTTKKDGGTSGSSSGDDDDDDSAGPRRSSSSGDTGGCGVVEAPFDGGAALLGAAVAVGLVLSARRRRSRT